MTFILSICGLYLIRFFILYLYHILLIQVAWNFTSVGEDSFAIQGGSKTHFFDLFIPLLCTNKTLLLKFCLVFTDLLLCETLWWLPCLLYYNNFSFSSSSLLSNLSHVLCHFAMPQCLNWHVRAFGHLFQKYTFHEKQHELYPCIFFVCVASWFHVENFI